ncbi:hypothetical protein CYMTET_18873 [Cymbomonas tetramitiformis]|uniref:Uncharacterized protein n=1 Tax=Cymbomonas tetramitiformis TaxID=36881 RepID=A0AAE0G8I0_9CHLO|nr:hypothetical protein CYMTET_18873 [Cymbomonas tetramitiformis]
MVSRSAMMLDFVMLLLLMSSCAPEPFEENEDYLDCLDRARARDDQDISLARCQLLSLAESSLSGTLPTELGEITTLTKLVLNGNSLTRNLPTELGQLTQLQHAFLYTNQISGLTPTELGQLTDIRSFFVSINSLSGQLPTELGQLTRIEDFGFHVNQFEGTLPTELGKMTSITHNWMVNENCLSGAIPTEVGMLTRATLVSLSTNNLQSVPSELGNLQSVTHLDLSYNYNAMQGKIPSNLGLLNQLTLLDLNSNSFSGSIPSELGQLNLLHFLYMHICELSGAVPTELGKLTAMKHLDYYNNYQLGQADSLFSLLPTELGMLSRVTQLKTETSGTNEEMSFRIPSQINGMSDLQSLNISGCRISGTLPAELGELTNLTSIDVQQNSLYGSLPPELDNLHSLTNLALSYNENLCGAIPERTSNAVSSTKGTSLGEDCPTASPSASPTPIRPLNPSHLLPLCDAYLPPVCITNQSTIGVPHLNPFHASDNRAYCPPQHDSHPLAYDASYVQLPHNSRANGVGGMGVGMGLRRSDATLRPPPPTPAAAPPQPPLPCPPPFPPCPPPPGFAALPVTRDPEAPEATTVSFFFEGADAVSFRCQLDEGALADCTSPYEVAWLAPGNHTFAVHAVLDSGEELEKEVVWEVAPRLRFVQELLQSEVIMPNTRTELLQLQSSEEGALVTSSDYRIEYVEVRLASDWPVGSSAPPPDLDDSSGAVALMAFGSKADSHAVQLLLDASAVNASTVGNYTVRVAVRDRQTECTSRVSAWAAVTVRYQSSLLLMPSDGDVVARSGSHVDVVVAGQEPLASAPWVIFIGTGASWTGTCASSTTFNITALDNQTWARVEPTSGTLGSVGEQAKLTVVFSELLNPTASNLVASFRIYNSEDGSEHQLRILLTIVPSAISNSSTVRPAERDSDTGALQTGGNAEWIVAPFDGFGNALTESDDSFMVDVFRVETVPAALKELDGQPDARFDAGTGLYSSGVGDMTPYGAYIIYVRYVDRDRTQEALTEAPAANWTDPQGCQLQGSPLEFYFEPVECNAEVHQSADSDGLECQCDVGYYNNASAGERLSCQPCGYGRFGAPGAITGAGQDEACSLCQYEGSTDGLTTLRADATSLEECVCQAGFHHSPGNLRNCTACAPGSFQDVANASDCALCAIGTRSDAEGRAEPCSASCASALEVAPVEGLAECLPCAPDTHATYMCRYNGTWLADTDAAVCNGLSPSTTRAACVCNPNFYQTIPDDLDTLINQTCAPCSAGATCLFSVMRGNAGYWRRSTAESQFYACTSSEVCLGELAEENFNAEALLEAYLATGHADALGRTSEAAQVVLCADGHEAVLCGACKSRWILRKDATCEECGDTEAERTFGHIMTLALLALAALAAVAWLQRPFYADVEVHYKEMSVTKVKAAAARLVDRGKTAARAGRRAVEVRWASLRCDVLTATSDSREVGLASIKDARKAMREDRLSLFSDVDDQREEDTDGRATESTAQAGLVGAVRPSTGALDKRAGLKMFKEQGKVYGNFGGKASMPGQAGAGAAGTKAGVRDQQRDSEFFQAVKQMAAVLLSFSQIMASFHGSFGIQWPAGFAGLLLQLSACNFAFPSLPGLPSSRCTLNSVDWLWAHALCVAFPVAAVLFMWGVASASYRLQWRRRHLVEYKQYRFFIVRTMLFILYLSYISISVRMLSFFNCTELYGEYFLSAELHVQCWVGGHRRLVPLALVGVCLYPLGLPAVFLYFLWRYRVPALAAMKWRACLLQAAAERLASDASRDCLGDALVDLETFPLEELRALSAKAAEVDGQGPQAGAGGAEQKAGESGASLASLAENQEDHDEAGSEIGSEEEAEQAAAEREALIKHLVQWIGLTRRGKQYTARVFWDTTEHENPTKTLQGRWALQEASAILRVGFIFKAYHVQGAPFRCKAGLLVTLDDAEHGLAGWAVGMLEGVGDVLVPDWWGGVLGLGVLGGVG